VEAVQYIVAMFRAEEGIVRMKCDNNLMVIYNNDCALYVRLSEGKALNGSKIIKQMQCSKPVRVTTASLTEVVNKVAVAVDPESTDHSAVDIETTIEGEFRVFAESQYGRSTAAISYTTDHGDDLIECRVRHSRLLKAVKQFGPGILNVGLSDNGVACVFTQGNVTWLLAVIGE
jgi:hypothetical protein